MTNHPDHTNATARMFAYHLSEFHDHPNSKQWPCPDKSCEGTMVFDLGMEGCYCSGCRRYDGTK